MSDEQELEERLRNAFRSGSLPAAPAGLVSALEAAPNAPVLGSRRRRGSWPRVLAVAAVLLVGGAVALSVGNRAPSPRPLPIASMSPEASLPAEPAPSAPTRITYDPQWTADVPFDVDDLSAAVTIVQQRINATGIVGGQVATDDQGRIVVDLPPGTDPDPIRRLIGQTGFLEFVPLDGGPVETGILVDPARAAVIVSGDIADASAVNEGQTGKPALQITLRSEPTARFAEYTSTNIGSTFAITLDRRAIAVPTIQSEVPDGVVQIIFASSSAPDPAELARLATIIRLGPLPVVLVEVAMGPSPSTSTPAAVDPPIRCGPRVAVGGDQLECQPAVQAALAILPVDHAPIALVTFNHNCRDVIGKTVPDCAVQMSGIVEVTFVDGSPPVRIAVSIGGRASILPALPTPAPSKGAGRPNVAPADFC
jgi:hypothetical protein